MLSAGFIALPFIFALPFILFIIVLYLSFYPPLLIYNVLCWVLFIHYHFSFFHCAIIFLVHKSFLLHVFHLIIEEFIGHISDIINLKHNKNLFFLLFLLKLFFLLTFLNLCMRFYTKHYLIFDILYLIFFI